MVKLLTFLVSLLLLHVSFSGCMSEKSTSMSDGSDPKAYALAIHGGAGVIKKENMTDSLEGAYRQVMDEALSIGEDILKNGGESIEAVTAVVMHMEDSPLFNAGKGAVFTHEGENEMDASIMDGRDLNAGAVGGVKHIKNPILAAKAVLEKSEHVMLTGEGAEQFAADQGIGMVDPSYFHTQRRWDALQRILDREEEITELDHDSKHGTVGAVALDKDGNLAAATSTGGMTNKRYNRIGDSPIIGAGTYANNATCAVSSTGHGEYFIRYAVAHAISAQMQYGGKSLQEAGDDVVHKQLVQAGGTGGIISVDKWGNIHMPFNTPGMFRGYAIPNDRNIRIYKRD